MAEGKEGFAQTAKSVASIYHQMSLIADQYVTLHSRIKILPVNQSIRPQMKLSILPHQAHKSMHLLCFLDLTKNSLGNNSTWLRVQEQVLKIVT